MPVRRGRALAAAFTLGIDGCLWLGALARNECGGSFGEHPVDLIQAGGIDVGGHGHAGVAEFLLQVQQVASGGFGVGRGGVPSGVQPDRRQTGGFGVTHEPGGDGVGMPGPPVGPAEEQVHALRGVPAGNRRLHLDRGRPDVAGRIPPQGAQRPVGAQVGDRVGVKADDAVTAPGLDLLVDRGVSVLGQLMAERDRALVEVQTSPIGLLCQVLGYRSSISLRNRLVDQTASILLAAEPQPERG